MDILVNFCDNEAMATDTFITQTYDPAVEGIAFFAPDMAPEGVPVGVALCVDAAGVPIVTADQMDCTRCRGWGEVETGGRDQWGDWLLGPCPRCDGFGLEP